jgi:hypothetical protein
VTHHDEYTGCPGCGEMEDKDCRCTGPEIEALKKAESLERLGERLCDWGPGSVELEA